MIWRGFLPLLQEESGINGIAADLPAVVIEISQRRSFPDLQAALDAGASPGSASSKKASFVPPPVYDDSSPNDVSPRPSVESFRAEKSSPPLPPSPGLLSPFTPRSTSPPSPSTSSLPPRSPSSGSPSPPSVKTHLAPNPSAKLSMHL